MVVPIGGYQSRSKDKFKESQHNSYAMFDLTIPAVYYWSGHVVCMKEGTIEEFNTVQWCRRFFLGGGLTSEAL